MKLCLAEIKTAVMPNVGKKRNMVFALILLAAAMLLRISGALGDTLWVDEAESAINGLTILETGLPKGQYLGIPIYENTLTEPWETSEEYAYRDSSYSLKRNVVVYHGWLPLYAIAVSQAVFGLKPDPNETVPPHEARHGREDIRIRTLAPRVPALVFSFFTCIVLFYLMRHIGGRTAGLGALTWFGLSGMPTWFGTQSRYYPMTLLMVTLVAYTFYRTTKWGNWRSFILLGITEGLLFHTHQLSSVAFALSSVAGLPVIIRHKHWFWKCGVAVSIATVMTLPWALWAGFFDAASHVPNVFQLFGGLYDWVYYCFEHPKSLFVVAFLVGLVIALLLFPQWVPVRCREALSKHRFYYLFLAFWMSVIYGCFHTLIPAASYFTDRLTLMLLMPFVMMLGLLWGDISRVAVKRWQGLLCVILTILSIFLLHRPAKFYGFGFDLDRLPLARLCDYLKTTDFAADTRFYGTPSNQLIYTYYSGLPVQSTVPVRKSFFDNYPGEVVILNTRSFPKYLDPEIILQSAQARGLSLDADGIREVQWHLWAALVYEHDQRIQFPLPGKAPELSEFEASLLSAAKEYTDYWETLAIEEVTRYPIFEGVVARNLDEYWMVFFTRFLDYRNHIGPNLNYLERVRSGEVEYHPYASLVLYRSKGRVNVLD